MLCVMNSIVVLCFCCCWLMMLVMVSWLVRLRFDSGLLYSSRVGLLVRV